MDKRFYTSKKLDRFLFAVVILYCAVVVFGFLGGYFKTTAYFDNTLGQKIVVDGFVLDEPQDKTYGTQFVLHSKNNILVSTKQIGITYGDEVVVEGVLETPQNFMTDQGTTFDYVSYLYKDDILYQIKNASTTIVSHGHGNWVTGKLIRLKQYILLSYKKILPAQEADLLGGINLGEKQHIDARFRDALITTGTVHIIALSGYNVTIVANALRDFLIEIVGVALRYASMFGILGIGFFVAMTGFQSSAIRAGIMAVIGIFARRNGRTYTAFRALVCTGFIMVVWNPKYLVYDISFQLSFLATLGIIFITPILERVFIRIPKKVCFCIPLRELMSVTLGAQIGVLPFILYKMGTLSIVALPANILILPAIPYTMALGAVSGFIGMASSFFAYPISLVTHLLLKYITWMIGWFAKIPYASVTLTEFPLWLCMLLYVILIWIIYRNFSPQQTS